MAAPSKKTLSDAQLSCGIYTMNDLRRAPVRRSVRSNDVALVDVLTYYDVKKKRTIGIGLATMPDFHTLPLMTEIFGEGLVVISRIAKTDYAELLEANKLILSTGEVKVTVFVVHEHMLTNRE